MNYWVKLKDFPLYEVSLDGRIRRLPYQKKCGYKNSKPQSLTLKELKPRRNKKGYYYVALYANGLKKEFRFHRLVYETFMGLIDKDLEINHIDCDKSNNSLYNLEAITHQENMNHAVKNNLLKK